MVGLQERVRRIHVRIPRGHVCGRFVGVRHLCGQTHRVHAHADGAQIRGDGLAFQQGDILYSALRPEQNKVALAPWSGIASPEILVLRPTDPGLRHALVLWLTHPLTTQLATQLARGTGRSRVRWADLAAALSDGPDDPTLRRLASISTQIGERLDLLHTRCAAHQALLRAATSSGQGGPKWGDVGALLPPPSAPSDGDSDLPLIDVSCLRSADLSIGRQSTRQPTGPHRRVNSGDVLVSRVRPMLRKAGLCPTNALTTPELVPFRFEPVWRTAAVASLTHPHLWQTLIGASSGTRMPRVRLEHLKRLPMGVDAQGARDLHRELGPIVEHLIQAPQYGHALHALRTRFASEILGPQVSLTTQPVCRTSHTG